MGSIFSVLKAWFQPALPPSTVHQNDVEPMQVEFDSLEALLSRLDTTHSSIESIVESEDGGVHAVGQVLTVGGWVRTGRVMAGFAFLEVSDGTSSQPLQALVTPEVAEAVGGLGSLTSTGTSVLLQGTLTTSSGTKQAVELKVSEVLLVGPCDNSAGKYPLAKRKMTREFLRTQLHLRMRTMTFEAAMRLRSALTLITHEFFQARGFLHVDTPNMTTSDTEGAGEMFQVTTVLPQAERAQAEEIPKSDEKIARLKQEVSEQKEVVGRSKQDFEADKKNTELQKTWDTEKKRLTELKKDLERLMAKADEQRRMVGGILWTPEGKIDYKRDFHHKPIFLSVSGQLHLECYASGIRRVYTFGPRFRAEHSNTARHLAEFWMVELELAFANIVLAMDYAEAYVRHCIRCLLQRHRRVLELLTRMVDKDLIERLRIMAATPFERCTYEHAIELLEEAVQGGKKFEFPVRWGIDLASEHERFLTEEIFKKPTIVYDYPKDVKPFYMRLNDDGKTVAGFDVLVPGIGELIGGGQREERLDVLTERMQAADMHLEHYKEYIDLRRYGTAPRSGFGVGFERLVMLVTGLDNIRDAIPFPRYPGHAEL